MLAVLCVRSPQAMVAMMTFATIRADSSAFLEADGRDG